MTVWLNLRQAKTLAACVGSWLLPGTSHLLSFGGKELSSELFRGAGIFGFPLLAKLIQELIHLDGPALFHQPPGCAHLKGGATHDAKASSLYKAKLHSKADGSKLEPWKMPESNGTATCIIGMAVRCQFVTT